MYEDEKEKLVCKEPPGKGKRHSRKVSLKMFK